MLTATADRQVRPAEDRFADELAFLAAWDAGPRPAGWRLTPRAVVTFVVGSGKDHLRLNDSAGTDVAPGSRRISAKYIGERSLIERCVVTLAGDRGLLLVGEPGTAKSMLSELLGAAISGTSTLTVQGTAGTTEDQLRYGWNYALLLARGPSREALIASPVLQAMRGGSIVRIEEVTRCLPEVQDALVATLSERRLSVPELTDLDQATEYARPGFNVIATANLRDRGVSEMSAALKRRFNFELVEPIADRAAEVELVRREARARMETTTGDFQVDDAVLEVLVTTFRDLRSGRSEEGWAVERPSTVLSTAEAVAVATSLALHATFLGGGRDALSMLPGHLLGVVRKDDPQDQGRLLGYWDAAVKRRAEAGGRPWRQLWELRSIIEG